MALKRPIKKLKKTVKGKAAVNVGGGVVDKKSIRGDRHVLSGAEEGVKGRREGSTSGEDAEAVFKVVKQWVRYDAKEAKLYWTDKPKLEWFSRESVYKTWVTRNAGREINTEMNGQRIVRFSGRSVPAGRVVWMLVNNCPVPKGRNVLTKRQADGLKATNFYLSG